MSVTTIARPTVTAGPVTPTTATATAVTHAPPTVPVTALLTCLEAAGVAVAELPADDPRWEVVGPRLTVIVDAARRLLEGSGSTIGPDESVAPVLRLRDLAGVTRRPNDPDARVPGTLLASVAEAVGWLEAQSGREARTP